MHHRVSIFTVRIPDIFNHTNALTALTPFHKNAAGDFWTSNAARNIRDMGYTYPELANNPSNATLVASVKAQYAGPADVPVTSTKARRALKRGPSEELFLAEISFPAYGLDNGRGGSAPYNVLLFLGDVPTDTKTWQHAESFVGLASTMGGVTVQSNQIVSQTIDLSTTLQKAIDAGATTTENAKEYLKENIHYRLGLVSTVAVSQAHHGSVGITC